MTNSHCYAAVIMSNSRDSLAHHGIKGMRWGVRRYQNKDGSLTPEGRRHKDNYIKANLLARPVYAEGQKLINSDSRLRRDFVSYSNVDDDEYFEHVARGYGLNTDPFRSANSNYKRFVNENYKSIKTGENIIKHLIAQEKKSKR